MCVCLYIRVCGVTVTYISLCDNQITNNKFSLHRAEQRVAVECTLKF